MSSLGMEDEPFRGDPAHYYRIGNMMDRPGAEHGDDWAASRHSQGRGLPGGQVWALFRLVTDFSTGAYVLRSQFVWTTFSGYGGPCHSGLRGPESRRTGRALPS